MSDCALKFVVAKETLNVMNTKTCYCYCVLEFEVLSIQGDVKSIQSRESVCDMTISDNGVNYNIIMIATIIIIIIVIIIVLRTKGRHKC